MVPVGLRPTTGRVPREGGGDHGQVFRPGLVPNKLVVGIADVNVMTAWMAMDVDIDPSIHAAAAAAAPSIILPRILRRSSASRVPGGVPILSVVVCRVV